jgi:hypothetical protein
MDGNKWKFLNQEDSSSFSSFFYYRISQVTKNMHISLPFAKIEDLALLNEKKEA